MRYGILLSRKHINTDKFYTIDLICAGPLPTKIHAAFVDELEKKYHSRLTSFNSRYKKEGWLVLFGIAGILINRNSWCWCAIACLTIMFCFSFALESKHTILNIFVVWLSGQSFYIYLSHLMAFDLSWFIVDRFTALTGIAKYAVWGFHRIYLPDRSMYEYG